MRILLVGCTGFLGKALIYRILKTTNHTIFLAMRPKNNKNIKERMENILKDFNLDGYRRRIKPIEVKYDEERNIHIKQSDMKIVKKSDILVNALADVKFNRTLRKAVLNNTVTAMKWLELFKTFESPGKYIYVSSAYVNFDIKNEGIIEEKIYEENMGGANLIKILAGDQIDFKPYTNTYLYSKQLAEILLLEKREKIKLHIIRPSTIIPAVKYPYVGWGTIQTLNYIFFGIATGIVPCWNISIDDIYRYNINTVPVDIAAKDCIKCFQDPTDFLIRHSCLTGNNEFAITYELFYMLTLTAYQYFERHPLRLQDRTFKPYYPFYMKDLSYIKIVFFVLCYIYNCFRGNRRFFQTLKTSWKLTRNFNTHMPTFVSKKLIFKRKDKQKWFYKNFNAEKSYLSFIRNIGHFIEKNNELMKILVLC
jgi:nucleoside-diphosphate-sugar epimerase